MMSKNTSSIGKLGEDLASDYLKSKGYRIFGRNYREKIGEIDIIAISKDKTLIFVEVKTLKSGNAATLSGNQIAGLMPEDNLTSAKLKKLSRICEVFAARNPELVKESRGWRIDLIAISLDENLKPLKFNHYENLF